MEASWEKIQQARARAADTPWLMRVQDVFFTSIVAPDAAMLDEKTAQERQTRRVVALADADWFALDFRHVIWAAWLLLLAAVTAASWRWFEAPLLRLKERWAA